MKGWTANLRGSAFRAIALHRRSPAIRGAARLAQGCLAAYENDDGNFEHDGEAALLDRLSSADSVVLIDVGANVGNWSVAARRASQDILCLLGLLDDLVLIPLGIWLAIRLVPADVLAECRARAQERRKLVSRAAGAVIVAIWLALAGLGLWWAWRLWG